MQSDTVAEPQLDLGLLDRFEGDAARDHGEGRLVGAD